MFAMALDWQEFGSVLALVAILVTALLFNGRRKKELLLLPPGPWQWPILGNLSAVAVSLPHLNLQKLASKFGPLMYLRLGSLPCVVVSTAEAARALFRVHDEHLSSRPKFLSLALLTEYKTMGAAPSSGRFWHSMRRLSSSELLSAKRVASYQGTRSEELRHMMQLLLEMANRGDAVNVKRWLFQTAANLITRMLVNKRMYCGDESNCFEEPLIDEFEQWLQDRLNYITAPVIGDYIPSLRFYSERVQGWRSRIEAFGNREMALFRKILQLERHRERAASGEESHVPDFVDVMLAAPLDDGKPLEDKFIIKQVNEFFLAGVETTSTALEWALAELVTHPNLLKRAQEEIDDVVGVSNLVRESDIASLPFLQACVKETYRLRPTPLGLPRESTAPVEAMGYHIPAGTRIIYNAYAIHRDPGVYNDANEFVPERFLDRDVNPLAAFGSYELIPFGVGRRICPGNNLGNTVVHLVLANLIHSYDWELPEGVEIDLEDTTVVSLGNWFLRKPLTLVPRLREGASAF